MSDSGTDEDVYMDYSDVMDVGNDNADANISVISLDQEDDRDAIYAENTVRITSRYNLLTISFIRHVIYVDGGEYEDRLELYRDGYFHRDYKTIDTSA